MIKIALASLALALSPALAYADCGQKHVQLSCADGKIWDDKTASCIAPTG